MPILIILQTFVKAACPEVAFPENRLRSLFGLWGPIIYRPDELCQKNFWFRASLWYFISGQNFMIIRLAVSEILGGWFSTLQMPVSCQKEQMLWPLNLFLLPIHFRRGWRWFGWDRLFLNWGDAYSFDIWKK